MVPSVLVLALSAPAVSATAADVRFGVFGGVSFATLDFDPELNVEGIDKERAIGPAGGVTAEFALSEKFLIDTRAQWVRKGVKFTALDLGDADARIRIDYLSVPVLFKLKGGGSTRPYVAVGPEISFQLSAKTITTLGDEEEEEDVSDDLESTDFGLAAAVGVEFPAGSTSVFVEAGYSHGLSSLADETESDGVSVKNRAFLFLAGVRF